VSTYPVALLAGGLATRLRPLSERIPKALLSMAGRPFVFHQLELLRRQGVEQVVLCVGHLSQQIEAAVGDGRAFGLSIRYSNDGEQLLGTGGAIAKALPLLGGRFFVMYGDSYLRCPLLDIQRAYERSQRPALMTVLRNDNRWDRSNVLYRDGKLLDYDKHGLQSDHTHIDFGLMVFSSAIFAGAARSARFDLADVCQELSRADQLAAFEVTQRFYEIGSPDGLLETQAFLAGEQARV
jgi:MurNAc alpha-1-phosphate uridylyltransferase